MIVRMMNKISLSDHVVIHHIEDKILAIDQNMVEVQNSLVVRRILSVHWHIDYYNKFHFLVQSNGQYQSLSEMNNRKKIEIFIRQNHTNTTN